MRVSLRAAGMMRSGPERDLVDDYLVRADRLARGQGFLSVSEDAVDTSRCKNRAEATQRILNVPEDTKLILLDERGKSLTSRELSKLLARTRDDGVSSLAFIIGPADGFDPASIPPGLQRISFGKQTWPHKLVRVMLAEQLYRALSILSGSPYHRD